MIEKRKNGIAAIEQRILATSQSQDAVESLRRLVRELAAEGHKKQEIYDSFKKTLLAVRERKNVEDSEQEEVLLELMDMLSGFCKPELVLLPDDT